MHRPAAVRLVACGLVALGGLLAAGGGAAVAVDEPTGTTEPPATVPTTAPVDPLPGPTPPTTTTTGPPAVPTIPDHEHGELSALTPAQTLAAEAEYAKLTDAQRALLRQLQAAKQALSVRRFALVAIARDVTAAREQLAAAQATERQARARVDDTRARLKQVKDEIVAMAAAAYRNHADSWAAGAVTTIDVVNAGELSRAQTYARSDAAFLGLRVDELEALERRLESERRTAESARVAAETAANDLDARLAEQRQAYDDAAASAVKTQAAVVRSLGADVALVAQLLDPQFGGDDIRTLLAYVQAGQTEPLTLDGIFAMPIPGATLSSAYGLRIDPISGTVAFHAGLDFGVPMRTPIKAAAAGTVVIAGDNGGYGNAVVIDHGTHLATLYGHMSEIGVRVGDVVAAGQVIGLVGSTGKSTGPHLHFEVRHHGAPIDPLPTLIG